MCSYASGGEVPSRDGIKNSALPVVMAAAILEKRPQQIAEDVNIHICFSHPVREG